LETGPLPWDTIKPFYTPPAALPPWDDSMVKYGNTKDPGKRAEKLAETKAAYELQLASEQQAIADHRAEWASKAALSPLTGQVLAIGIRKGNTVAIIGDGGETEPEILEACWNIYRKHSSMGDLQMIGYYSNLFDFPFLVWRSYFHGIRLPESIWDKSGRYPAYCFVDLFDRLPNRGLNGESKKLTDICSWLGLGAKPEGVDGGMFAALWSGNEESKQEAIAYLINDLDMTYKLAERMGVI
jgi:hypothetical protein